MGGAVHAFRLLRNSTTKATDHELQKYDNFTRYGQAAVEEALTQGASVDTVDSLGIPAMTPLGLAAVLRSRERRWAFDRSRRQREL